MNKIGDYILIMTLLLGLGSCEDFLEETSQNEVRPGSVVDLEELMVGEVYPVGSTFHNYLEILTDDVESSFTNASMSGGFVKRWEGAYTWQKNMYELLEVSGAIGFWGARIDTYEHYYKCIRGCNVVLDMLDKVKGDEEAKANVRGQALGMRAWFYFMLVNLYGQPYNAKGVNIESSPGVPLLISSVVKDDLPVRASVASVYRQVEADLLEALPLIEKYGQGNNKYKVTDMFIYTLLSRMYLYMEKWEQAAEYATKVIQKKPNLINLADYVTETAVGTFSDGVYGLNSPEAIWFGYGLYANQEYAAYDWTGGFARVLAYAPSTALKALYNYNGSNPDNRKDMRYRYYYFWYQSYPSGGSAPVFGDKKSATETLSSKTVKGMRVAELYLNRAEAYIHLDKGADALADLNELRKHRYDTRKENYQPENISGREALLQFCQDERRRELSFEDHRWFDLRRYGMPEIKHMFQSEAGQTPQEYILRQGSPRYVLPIPDYVLERNPELVPNP
jgi:hypothetical protein